MPLPPGFTPVQNETPALPPGFTPYQEPQTNGLPEGFTPYQEPKSVSLPEGFKPVEPNVIPARPGVHQYSIENLTNNLQLMGAVYDYATNVMGVDPKELKTNQDVADFFVSDRRWKDMNTVSIAKQLWQTSKLAKDDTADGARQRQNLRIMKDAWSKVPDVWEEGGAGWSGFFANVGRALVDPTTVVAGIFGRGFSKVGGLIAGVATDAAITGGVNVAEQQSDINIQTPGKTEIDPKEALLAAALGAGASIPGHVLSSGVLKGATPEERVQAALAATRKATADGTIPQPGTVAPAAAKEIVPDPNVAMSKGGETMTMGPVAEGKIPDKGRPQASIVNNTIGLPADQQALRLHSLEDNAWFPEARRGIVSDPKLLAVGNKMVEDDAQGTLNRILSRPAGAPLNAEDTVASGILYKKLSLEYADLLSSNTGTLEEKANLLNKFNIIKALNEEFVGAGSEQGRALRARQLVLQDKIDDPVAIAKIIKSFGGVEDSTLILDATKELIGNRPQFDFFMKEMSRPDWKDKFWEIWYNSLLSGLSTQVVNNVGNLSTSLLHTVETGVAAGIGGVRSVFGIGSKDRVYFGEAPAQLYGMLQGSINGIQAAARTFITEVKPGGTVGDFEHKAIGGVTGQIVRLPQRALAAADEFFKALNRDKALSAMAYREAADKAKPGTPEFNKALADARNSYIPGTAAYNKAQKEAEYLTFTNPGGKLSQALVSLTEHAPALRFILPFVKTPANLIKFGFERSPFALLMEDTQKALAAGGRERDMALARIGLGSAVMTVTGALGAAGYITGSAPVNPQERAMFESNDHLAYSLKIPGTNVQYELSRVDPVGQIFGFGADLPKLANAITKDEWDNVAGIFVNLVSQNIINKTYLQGISNIFQAIQDPERFGQNFANGVAGTFVPTIVSQATRADDRYMRDARTLMDSLLNRTPMRVDSLEKKYNLWGEPKEKEAQVQIIPFAGEYVNNLISPYTKKTINDDKVKQEADKLNLKIAEFPKKLDNYELPRDVFAEATRMRGELAYKMMQQQVNSPGWDKLLPGQKSEIYHNTFSVASDMARKEIISKYPVVASGMANAKMEGITKHPYASDPQPFAKEIMKLFGKGSGNASQN